MDIEELKKRLVVIDEHINQYTAKLNMLMGGKEELLYWIAQSEKVDESPIAAGGSE